MRDPTTGGGHIFDEGTMTDSPRGLPADQRPSRTALEPDNAHQGLTQVQCQRAQKLDFGRWRDVKLPIGQSGSREHHYAQIPALV